MFITLFEDTLSSVQQISGFWNAGSILRAPKHALLHCRYSYSLSLSLILTHSLSFLVSSYISGAHWSISSATTRTYSMKHFNLLKNFQSIKWKIDSNSTHNGRELGMNEKNHYVPLLMFAIQCSYLKNDHFHFILINISFRPLKIR